MADMSPWWLASLALVVPLGVPMVVAGSGKSMARFVALQLVSSLTMIILILLSFALDQSSFIDLPLGLALLSLPGVLAMAIFLERWL
jgi:multicomponent Na+:H+ antiporter subunit F